MGLLRTLFAISVVFAHTPWHGSGGYLFVGGRNAVQLFYMISGFLISYILNNSPAYRSTRTFYISRALRIYPVYFLVAGLALLASVALHVGAVPALAKLPWDARTILVAANALIFGQDWVMFLSVHSGHVGFTADFAKSDILVFSGLLVPQAWTLGLELTFYLLAPYIVRSKTRIAILLGLSLAARAAFYIAAPDLAAADPWTYRFFPFELALFLAGALSQQIVLPLWQAIPQRAAYATYATAGFVALSVLTFLLPGSEFLKSIVLFAIFFACLPLVFIFQNGHKWDALCGELSYPIYVGHWLVLGAVLKLAPKVGIVHPVAVSFVAVAAAIGFALLLDIGVARPLEKIRKRLSRHPALAPV